MLWHGYTTNATVWLHLTMTSAVICFVLFGPVFLASYHHLLTDENLFKLYFLFKFNIYLGNKFNFTKRGKQQMSFIAGWICKTHFINQLKIAELAIEWV